jgi:cytosine permease
MLVTAIFGFKFMKILNYIAVPVLFAICLYGMIYAVNHGSGWSAITSSIPSQTMSLTAAISTVIGLFAIGTVINNDYSRYGKSRGSTVAATFVGVLPAAVFMILVGAIMAISAGNSDITAVFASLGLPVLAMLVLILATWTTNTGNAYTAGLAAMKFLSLKDSKRPIVTFIIGLVGIALAIAGLANVLNSFISVLASLVPPIAGVMIADYWIVGKGKSEDWSPKKGFNWNGIIAWASGSTVALFFSFFSPALDGIIVCGVVYIVLNALFGKTVMGGQGDISVEEIEANMK